MNAVRAGIVEKPEDYEQSSYRAYITKAEGDISDQELILSMISKDKGEARKKYKVFVEKAIGKELKNPLKEAYGGIILGGVQFIKETLKKVERGKLSSLFHKYTNVFIVDNMVNLWYGSKQGGYCHATQKSVPYSYEPR